MEKSLELTFTFFLAGCVVLDFLACKKKKDTNEKTKPADIMTFCSDDANEDSELVQTLRAGIRNITPTLMNQFKSEKADLNASVTAVIKSCKFDWNAKKDRAMALDKHQMNLMGFLHL
jgi:hypothetical protein